MVERTSMKHFIIPLASLFLLNAAANAAETKYLSHPPQRPLPVASNRPLDKGPALYVDPVKGNDANDGSKAKPWKTLGHAATKLKPGDTLYLHGGVYYEHAVITVSGTPEAPVTIRAVPGELAILDGGIREFAEEPAKAWEPNPDGVAGEYRSVKLYPDLGGRKVTTNLLGNFLDSMIPLHGYRFLADLRSQNVYWNLAEKVGEDKVGIYCGPGLFYDLDTGRIHARLAPTNMKWHGENNYTGETDPRKLPITIAGTNAGPVLSVREARHIRLQDLVIRGARMATFEVFDCGDVTLDGLTLYGGTVPISVKDTVGLRMVNTVCRGIQAPWGSRASMKYRSLEARLFATGAWAPSGPFNRDFEIAHCEFTDSCDGVFLGNVQGCRFHHNLVDNVSDDGLFLTSGTGYDGVTPGGGHLIYQNLFSRCLTTFAFGVGHGMQRLTAKGKQTGSGAHIFRNVFDFRGPIPYHLPEGPDKLQELVSRGRFAGDHGSPTWEPMFIYHNTILAADGIGGYGYDYGAFGFTHGMALGARRRVFNNIVVQEKKFLNPALVPVERDLQMDGNLYWNVAEGAMGNFLADFRKSKIHDKLKANYPAGFAPTDRYSDPKLTAYSPDWTTPANLILLKDSPAIDTGVAIPADWPDPLRAADAGKPDVGVLPLGAEPWRVGLRGRLSMFGEVKEPLTAVPELTKITPLAPKPVQPRPTAIVEGYPAFDNPVIHFALRKKGVPITEFDRTWLDTKDYGHFQLVIIGGTLARGGVKPSAYSKDDLPRVQQFLEEGGTLMLLSGLAQELFASPEGRDFLTRITGGQKVMGKNPPSILKPGHPWLKHIDGKSEPLWLAKGSNALAATKGTTLIGTKANTATLYEAAVGKGRLIYVGWVIAQPEYLPTDKRPAEYHQAYEDQLKILFNIVADIYP